ncbi:uncharacterized protein Z520_10495 [Fonsecaea multimorphosa CBS 102226]|uniref:BZIP domain-containing protein n=1 Tax=Fonsecaea multimorphosa CBS 102226 TaxID=1442371 RepID=A0A0D2GW95_9EURO|nr:uncharacterized protein Z520_10495 [Fonsecaea multimorphosa CBS 102226]KIX93870.1 hypothetical protein Z520_10495 [Fonsecaea multimorphosa CBS 102226]OAL19108.1 hypothetical protein AYO22_10056 [Fonsecaea multimorphosa]
MDSESSEGSTKVDAAKSKQQRVRDNQRRSRARRREYLAELENQLQQCHNTCREADLQRTALAELQAENARLRDLLKNVGISPDNVGISEETTLQRPGGLTAASFRQLKPKLFVPEVTNPATAVSQTSDGRGACCPTPSPSSCCTPQPPVLTENLVTYDTQYSDQLMAPPLVAASTMSAMRAANGFPNSLHQWYLPPHETRTHPPSEPSFVCHVFLVPPNGPLWADDSNSISCSVAKDMITQYNPTPEEMEPIIARLSTAFSRPRFRGDSCRVNRQVLFQILYEMNSNQDLPFATGQVIDVEQSGL